ncbi:MAG: chemotaxis protein CheX [Candidatus Delongbacteria bacterium]|nr:chemotaxis protein CheX [Candidatus Delongbacteria bacterium]MBN2834248.1 chemotaxis protein CheX [Candidatus Delongbacteria bacterium]
MEMIPTDVVRQAMVETIEEIFESMMFMDAIALEKNVTIESNYMVRMLINHPFPGEIVVKLNEDLLIRMSSNLYLLEDDEISEKVKNDLAYEITNTIAGKLMDKLVPETSTFKLGLPEMTDSVFIEDDSDNISVSFVVDDEYYLKIHLYMSI